MSLATTDSSTTHRPGLDPNRGGALVGEHHRIEAMLDGLLVAMLQGATDQGRRWSLIAGAVEGHLSIEERELLPRFEPCEPAIVARIAAEHAAIRAVMRQVAGELERGAVPVEPVQRLRRLLSEHAEGERRDFYPWIDRRLMKWVWARVLRATTTAGGRGVPPAR